MNKAEGLRMLFEDTLSADLHHYFIDFLLCVQEVRLKLGASADLVDKYVILLLEMYTTANLHLSINHGYTIGSSLCMACTDNTSGCNSASINNIKGYISKTTLPDKWTSLSRKSIYYSMLSAKLIKEAYLEYCNEVVEQLTPKIDDQEITLLYEKICSLLGGDSLMRKVDDLFIKRFVFVSVPALFLQGEAIRLAEALVHKEHDIEKKVVQLLLENALPLV